MERLNSFRHLNQKWSNGEHSNELLHAQAHIWNHIFSFINSMSLKSAIQLGIPDIINKHGCPMTLSELTSALPIHPTKSHSVYRLMRMLVHSGFFAKKKLSKTDEEGYTLTDASQLLLKDHPLSLTPFLTAIADAFPHIECTVLDLPHVVADLQGSKNLKYTGGDMFEAVPPADTVLLKWILHDWNDEECVKILKRSKEAITSKDKKGKVIIIDMMMENQKVDEESIETQLFFDMLMMALLTGKERNEKEWAKLFTDAGFSDYKITPILGLRSLIEVYP
ncbi:hypothetical protein ABKV19_008509 [Rosa sericea]